MGRLVGEVSGESGPWADHTGLGQDGEAAGKDSVG